MSDCPRCATLRAQAALIEAAARLTLLPSVLDRVEADLDEFGVARPGAVAMLLAFYRNVKSAANAVRAASEDAHGQ